MHSGDQLGIKIYCNSGSLTRNHKGGKFVEKIKTVVKVVNCNEKLFLCRGNLWRRSGKRDIESGITSSTVVLQISIKI